MFAKNVKQIVVLGGAFFVNGNVNPAAEANVNTIISARYIVIFLVFWCMSTQII